MIVSGANAHGHDHFEDLIAASRAGRLHRADHARRYRLLALHLGLDRQAEGRRACACEPEAHQRSLCRADPWASRGRRLLFGGEAVLRLRSRQRHDLPDVGWRDHGAACRPADAGRRRGAAAQASGDDVLWRADLLCGFLASREHAERAGDEIPPLRLRRRSAAGRCRQALERDIRLRHSRRHRLDRDASHLPVECAGCHKIRHHRQAGAGLRR